MKISRTQKLDGIWSWSLPALSTCPGARKKTGEVVDVCRYCYALQGRYVFPNVIDAREHNREDWKRPEWAQELAHRLRNRSYFRWFDSGDIYHPKLAHKILEVVRLTPHCQHWIPTRSYKVDRIRVVLEEINAEPNAVVRYSGDELDDSVPSHLTPYGSIVIQSADDPPAGVHVCPAYQHQPAQCNGCRACWDKSVPIVAYPLHGGEVKRLKAT